MTLLQASEVKKFYGVFCALDGVSLSIGEGEHVSIIGPNGAGKTTLVNVLTGLTPPSTGTVSFKGHDVGRTGALRLLRLGMARSFQLVNIFPLLTVRETIAVAAISNLGQGGRIFAGLRANKSVWDIVDRVADLFGFTSKLEQPAKSLSQGDKKLLDVASAFALRPEIILLDEPTSGVSTAEKAKIMGKGELRMLRWSDYKFDPYAISIITSKAMVEKDPDMLKGFLEASYHGWQDVFADPEAALLIFKKRVPELDVPTTRLALPLILDLLKTSRYEQNGIGYIDQEKMCKTVSVVNENMELPRKPTCEEVYTTALLPSTRYKPGK